MNNAIEKTIIEAINAVYPNFDIISFPIDFENFEFTNHDGCVLIKYENSTFSSQNTVWDVRQDETYEYKILTGLRYLTSFNQANPVIAGMKEILHGLFIVNHKAVFKQIKIEGVDNGDLWFSITIDITLSQHGSKQTYGGIADEIPQTA